MDGRDELGEWMDGTGAEGKGPVVFSEIHNLKEFLRDAELLLVCEKFTLLRKELYLHSIQMLFCFL